MSGGDVAKIVAALVPLGIAVLEHERAESAERNTVEVARVLAEAGQASSRGCER